MKYLILFVMLINTAVAETRLAWEDKKPKSSEWTKITLELIEKHYDKFEKAEDMETFCPQYRNLDKGQRIKVWGELVAAMAFYESGWNPNAQFTETGLGIDEITGKVLTSEGLLQLSYNDIKWTKACQFDWEVDKNNRGDRPTTILDPKNNLHCGITILARQVNKHKKIILKKGAYWAVIKEGHQNNKVPGIITRIQGRVRECTGTKTSGQ